MDIGRHPIGSGYRLRLQGINHGSSVGNFCLKATTKVDTRVATQCVIPGLKATTKVATRVATQSAIPGKETRSRNIPSLSPIMKSATKYSK
jgi:hypothetical protein